MGTCIFCRIAQKEIPAKVLAESSKVIAFHDVNPQAPLHVLIIPKEHIESVSEISKSHAETLSEMFAAAQKVADLEGVKRTGFRLVFNCGPDAGQAVDHLHMHFLAKRKLAWPPG